MSKPEQLITEHIDIWTSAILTKSTTGRGSNKKYELYGVKKLRELILELAVRGKLLPQDSNDEPASVLLEKIADEKSRLVKEGQLKKSKPLPKISDNEKTFEPPKGWEVSRLGDIVEIIRGVTFPGSEKSKTPEPGRVACLRTANVQDEIEWDDLLYIRPSFVKRDDQYILKNDIVMSMANSRELVGKVALIKSEPNTKTSFGGFLSVIRPCFVLPTYLMAVLRSPTSRESIIGAASQTTNIANISLAKLNPYVVCIPPLKEQHRIVAKVDELMLLCDQLEQQTEASIDAHATLVEVLLATLTDSADSNELALNWAIVSEHFDSLFTTEQSIEALKRTVLQLAVTGKLVPQNSEDEPASVLLEKITVEKVQLIKNKKIKRTKPLPLISDDEKPFDLPRGWEWCRLPEVGELARGKSKHRPRNAPELFSGGTIPLVQTGDVARAENVITTYTSLYNKNGLEQSRLWPTGTLCITIAANIADTAKLGFDACFPDSVVGFLPYEKKMDISYFDYFLRTAKNHLEDFAPSTAQKNINLEILGSLLVPLPPLNELNEITKKVKVLFSLCDQLKETLQQTQITQVQLTDALIDKALV